LLVCTAVAILIHYLLLSCC